MNTLKQLNISTLFRENTKNYTNHHINFFIPLLSTSINNYFLLINLWIDDEFGLLKIHTKILT